jgi:hypothetical protein
MEEQITAVISSSTQDGSSSELTLAGFRLAWPRPAVAAAMAAFFELSGAYRASPTSPGWLDYGRYARDPELPPPSMAKFLEIVCPLWL